MRVSECYLLKHRKPVRCADLVKAASGRRRVRLTRLKEGVVVSTVFLCVDHSIFGEPQLFETMIVIDGIFANYQNRCSTHRQALAMHWVAVKKAKNEY